MPPLISNCYQRPLETINDWNNRGILKTGSRNSPQWIDQKSSQYLESIISRIPSPPLVVHEFANSLNPQFTILDGSRRIQAICEFMNNILPIEYQGQKTRYCELDLKSQRLIANTPVLILEIKGYLRDTEDRIIQIFNHLI